MENQAQFSLNAVASSSVNPAVVEANRKKGDILSDASSYEVVASGSSIDYDQYEIIEPEELDKTVALEDAASKDNQNNRDVIGEFFDCSTEEENSSFPYFNDFSSDADVEDNLDDDEDTSEREYEAALPVTAIRAGRIHQRWVTILNLTTAAYECGPYGPHSSDSDNPTFDTAISSTPIPTSASTEETSSDCDFYMTTAFLENSHASEFEIEAAARGYSSAPGDFIRGLGSSKTTLSLEPEAAPTVEAPSEEADAALKAPSEEAAAAPTLEAPSEEAAAAPISRGAIPKSTNALYASRFNESKGPPSFFSSQWKSDWSTPWQTVNSPRPSTLSPTELFESGNEQNNERPTFDRTVGSGRKRPVPTFNPTVGSGRKRSPPTFDPTVGSGRKRSPQPFCDESSLKQFNEHAASNMLNLALENAQRALAALTDCEKFFPIGECTCSGFPNGFRNCKFHISLEATLATLELPQPSTMEEMIWRRHNRTMDFWQLF